MLFLGSVLVGEIDDIDLYGRIRAIGSPYTDVSSMFHDYSTFKSPSGHPQGGSLMDVCPVAPYPIDNQYTAEITPEEVLPQEIMPDPPVLS